MSFSFYAFKPRFQALLRPAVQALARAGVTANQVTVVACAVSMALGLVLYLAPVPPLAFALVPVWMLLRMALNAIDGMLAREHGQQSVLGTYLNELTDVLADAALYLPFARIAPFDPFWIGAIVLASALSEMAGALGGTVGAGRQYQGPMGKSDRAFVFGALGVAVAMLADARGLPEGWQGLAWVMPAVAGLTAWSVVNRIRAGVRLSNKVS
jgi:CDP-diacylglycerol--glycerol-3-phosphate 3-phosphatidyltransferase